jgi:iron complex transport system substrate-binding protein
MPTLDALLASAPKHPKRIVCLTEETTETLYRLGAGDVVVGISCFTLRPEEARSKPKVSSFLDAKFDEILALRPDLVVGFSDLQADLARELALRGVPVWIQNQRSVAEILQNVRVLGAMVGLADAAARLADELEAHVRDVAARAASSRKVRVFFEEWPDPLISGIRWVSELVEIAGGIDVCAESRARHDAKGRIFTLDHVASRDPEVIIASWCGKAVQRDEILARPQWANVTAVKNAQVHEIKSELILQPGPAALTDGVDAIARILDANR